MKNIVLNIKFLYVQKLPILYKKLRFMKAVKQNEGDPLQLRQWNTLEKLRMRLYGGTDLPPNHRKISFTI